MYTIVLLVLCFGLRVQPISCFDNKTHGAVKNGLEEILCLWPLALHRKNMVVTNLPLRLALNKLAVRATGKAKKELLATLGVTSDVNLTQYFTRDQLQKDLNTALESSLIMLNRLYVEESDHTDPGFFKDAKTFGVQVESMQFYMPQVAVSAINQWVDTATLKRISDIITTHDIDKRTSMILINAMHMKPTFETPFDVRLTLEKPFTLHDNKEVKMRMMTALDTPFSYAENNAHGFQMLSLPLVSGADITYVLPHKGTDLQKLLKVIAKNPNLLRSMRLQKVLLNVRLPVMKIKTLMNWNPYLKGIGVKEIFEHNHSGFDAISKPNRTKHYHMSKFLSKVFVDIDEFGIHRQAPEEPLDLSFLDNLAPVEQFLATRPFYFRIHFTHFDGHIELLSGVFYGTD